MRVVASLALVVVSVLASSCGGWPAVVRSAASADFGCPEDHIDVTDVDSPGIWEAKGCDHQARYQCWTVPHGGPLCRAVGAD
jgi:hypothetical protein